MKKIDSDPSLISFLETNGTLLVDFGSAEFGLGRGDAILFLDLINLAGKVPLGIEVWRKKGERYVIDSLGGWYSDASAVDDDNRHSAREFLSNVFLAERDLLTVQYKKH